MAVFGLNQGARIARLFKENDEVELTAVAGFGQQAIDVASEVGAKLYEDYNDLLANETLDGVAIALPNSLHLSATKACCEAGIKNILLEKPIANTPEEGQAIIDCCNEHNATLLIGHHRRSSNLFLFLKEFLATGKLGDIIGIQSSFAIAKEKHYWDAEWHKEPEGAILLVNAIHDLDDLNNVLNMKATRVYAAKRNTIRGYNAEDSCRPCSSSREALPQRTSYQTAHPLRGITTCWQGKTNSGHRSLAQIRCIFSAQRAHSDSRP